MLVHRGKICRGAESCVRMTQFSDKPYALDRAQVSRAIPDQPLPPIAYSKLSLEQVAIRFTSAADGGTASLTCSFRAANRDQVDCFYDPSTGRAIRALSDSRTFLQVQASDCPQLKLEYSGYCAV
jgi:hypothetical protein